MPEENLYPEARILEAFPIEENGESQIILRDPEGLIEELLVISPLMYRVMSFLNGSLTKEEVARHLTREGFCIDVSTVQKIITRLEKSLCMEGKCVEEARKRILFAYRENPKRPAAHAGASYPDEPEELAEFLDKFFQKKHGPGAETRSAKPVKAVISPHIDFYRGNVAYAWAYDALQYDPDPAEVFVILGTSHQPLRKRFALTHKHYETPFKTLPTDKALLHALQSRLGQSFFTDESAHRLEHSIEFQAVMLAYLFREKPISIVPILCASLHDLVGKSPQDDRVLETFLCTLQEEIQRDGRRVCLVAGVDLAHVGPRFGDRTVPTWQEKETLETLDRETMSYVCQGNAKGFFDNIALDKNARRICGFAPIYSLLRLLKNSRGELLYYQQASSPPEGSVVSFASVTF